jgi:predicted transcriptional regulator
MLPQRLDTLFAFKAIALIDSLSGTEKRVAIAIIDSFNRRTGQCDPGFDRIAHLLGISRRTVIRAVKRLEAARLVVRHRHRGKSHRNSYEPNWLHFRQEEARWSARKKTRHWKDSVEPDVSLLNAIPRHSSGDRTVTQTNLINQSNGTCPTNVGSPSSLRQSRAIPIRSVPSAEASLAAAERRWTSKINQSFRANQDQHAKLLDFIDEQMRHLANEAELQQPGSGFRLIIERFTEWSLKQEQAR